jgi:hypothetical protein
VKKRIVIGKFDNRPCRNHESVRLEAFVLLYQLQVLRQSRRRSGRWSGRQRRCCDSRPSHWSQPHDGYGDVTMAGFSSGFLTCHLDAPAHRRCHRLRHCLRLPSSADPYHGGPYAAGPYDGRPDQDPKEGAQKRTPIIRLSWPALLPPSVIV